MTYKTLYRRYEISYQTRNKSAPWPWDIIFPMGKSSSSAPKINEQRFYTIDETAAILRVSRITVQRKLGTKEIPSIHFGRRVLIPEAFLSNLENTNWEVR